MIGPNSLCKGKTEKRSVNKKPGSTEYKHTEVSAWSERRTHGGATRTGQKEKKELRTEEPQNRSEWTTWPWAGCETEGFSPSTRIRERLRISAVSMSGPQGETKLAAPTALLLICPVEKGKHASSAHAHTHKKALLEFQTVFYSGEI